jgi:hypothetical protein
MLNVPSFGEKISDVARTYREFFVGTLQLAGEQDEKRFTEGKNRLQSMSRHIVKQKNMRIEWG